MKTDSRRAFWDSSALAPLFCEDSFSKRSRQLLRQFPVVVVWWGSVLEIRAAFQRLHRQNHLDVEALETCIRFLNQFQLRWREIQPGEKIRALAEECIDRYTLRSADALQLASALIACRESPRGRPFLCFDKDLAKAAQHAGFQVWNT